MKTQFLLPHRYKRIGWIALILILPVSLYVLFTDYQFEFLQSNWNFNETSLAVGGKGINFTNTLLGSCFILAGLLVSFSKEKVEDEYIMNLRLNSFQWAFLVNYLLLFLAFVLVYDFQFLNVMIFNMFTSLILFIVRFNGVLLIQSIR